MEMLHLRKYDFLVLIYLSITLTYSDYIFQYKKLLNYENYINSVRCPDLLFDSHILH